MIPVENELRLGDYCMATNKLVVVGSGINGVWHMTAAARDWIQKADRVLYLIGDELTENIIRELNPQAESLLGLYDADVNRMDTYNHIVTLILGFLQMGETVCVVFYGHPGVFVNPGPDAVRKARAMGFEAVMMPGISAEDCLFADLAVDPARRGCQSYEATDFLARKRLFDPTAALVLWQIDGIGELTAAVMKEGYESRNVDVLADVLAEHYGYDHVVIIYEAATDPEAKPRIDSVTLRELPKTKLTGASTMYVPPKGNVRLDLAMMKRIGLK
jgi:siroheme synthase